MQPNNYNEFVGCRKWGEAMSPRTGRPKADNLKAVQYSIRLDADTERRVKAYCEKNGITKAEFIRIAIENLLSDKK